VAKQINDCEGKTILTTFDLIPLVRAVMKKCPTLKSVIVVGDPVEGCHTFSEMLKTERSSAKILLGSELNTLEETALLPYSSGTTVRYY
jgi:non-ribosomal peptide synthetase component E (peptide arylation enzyme)